MSSNAKDTPASRRVGSERTKRYHHKVRSGCRTCRERHLKCDEAKPICGRCNRLNLTCDFDRLNSSKQNPKERHYHAIVPHTREGSSDLLFCGYTGLNMSQGQPEEQRFLGYYLWRNTSRFSTSLKDTGFYDLGLVLTTLAPQIAQSSQAVRHAISAASTVEENLMQHSNTSLWLQERQHYHIHATIQSILSSNLSIEEVLICCLLMYSYTILNREFEAAELHLRSGLRLIQERKQSCRLPVLLAVEKALKALEPSLTLLFRGVHRKFIFSRSQRRAMKPFATEEEAHMALREIISDMTSSQREVDESDYAAWRPRFEASQFDFDGTHVKLTMHLYHAIDFVSALITAPNDSAVTETCKYAINDQLQNILTQKQACMVQDVDALQKIVEKALIDKSDSATDVEEVAELGLADTG